MSSTVYNQYSDHKKVIGKKILSTNTSEKNLCKINQSCMKNNIQLHKPSKSKDSIKSIIELKTNREYNSNNNNNKPKAQFYNTNNIKKVPNVLNKPNIKKNASCEIPKLTPIPNETLKSKQNYNHNIDQINHWNYQNHLSPTSSNSTRSTVVINQIPTSPIFIKKPMHFELKDNPENIITEQLEEHNNNDIQANILNSINNFMSHRDLGARLSNLTSKSNNPESMTHRITSSAQLYQSNYHQNVNQNQQQQEQQQKQHQYQYLQQPQQYGITFSSIETPRTEELSILLSSTNKKKIEYINPNSYKHLNTKCDTTTLESISTPTKPMPCLDDYKLISKKIRQHNSKSISHYNPNQGHNIINSQNIHHSHNASQQNGYSNNANQTRINVYHFNENQNIENINHNEPNQLDDGITTISDLNQKMKKPSVLFSKADISKYTETSSITYTKKDNNNNDTSSNMQEYNKNDISNNILPYTKDDKLGKTFKEIVKCEKQNNQKSIHKLNASHHSTYSTSIISHHNKEHSYTDSLLNMIGLKISRKYKCNCTKYITDQDTCQRALAWISIKYQPQEFEYLKQTYEKVLYNDELKSVENFIQVEKDIHRTHPEWKYIEPGGEGSKSLERVLKTFSKYDPTLGYVQGMNFIASSLLYHAEEYIAFWLLVMIFEMFEMRDIYLPKLPGLSKICQIIDILILNYIPDLYLHFCKYEIKVELFGAEWILALFGTIIPIEKMGDFYDYLLKEGWPFFYKLVNELLNKYKHVLLQQTDFTNILWILKKPRNIDKKENSLLKGSSPMISTDWDTLFMKAANNKNIDRSFINSMHLNFDSEKLTFKINSVDSR